MAVNVFGSSVVNYFHKKIVGGVNNVKLVRLRGWDVRSCGELEAETVHIDVCILWRTSGF